MFCSHCGKRVHEGAKFCESCGTRIGTPDDEVTAPTTAVVTEVGTVKAEKPITGLETAVNITAADQIGNHECPPLATFKHINRYIGTPFGSRAQVAGVLTIFSDRLEFDRKVGQALLALNVVGAIVSASSSAEVYPLEEIAELRVGKYLGVYKTLVVKQKNGDIWSFCPPAPGGSMAQNIINMLKPYMDRLNG